MGFSQNKLDIFAEIVFQCVSQQKYEIFDIYPIGFQSLRVPMSSLNLGCRTCQGEGDFGGFRDHTTCSFHASGVDFKSVGVM